MEKLDQFMSIFDSGLNIVVTLGSIFLSGFLAFTILPLFGFSGFSHYLLTGICALVGAGIIKMVMFIVAYLS